MISQSTLQVFDNTVKRFIAAEAKVIQSWQGYCGCSVPGLQLKCQSCPYFMEFIQSIQTELSTEPEKVFANILPPEISPPYPDDVRQRCVQMYARGYTLPQIVDLTGVKNYRVLRRWMKEEGLMNHTAVDFEEEKQACIDLYLEGMTPVEIEAKMGISADRIRNWVYNAGVARPKNSYSEEQKQLAVLMYSQAKPYQEIEEATGIPQKTVIKFAHQAGARRRRGRPFSHPPEVKQACLELLRSGKSAVQVEELMGISASTIHNWRKALSQTDDL